MQANSLKLLAETKGPDVGLNAEPLFEVLGFTITNSILYGLVISILLATVGIYLAKRSTVKPVRGAVAIFEAIVNGLISMMEGIFHDRKKALKYTPVFGTFFIFIVVSNVTGLLPIVGKGITYDGVSVFRPFTADLNGTLAMAIIAILLVQYYSIKESGFLGHLEHYFTKKPLSPINMFIGILEVFGELTRAISLSLRLFLNTAVGKILVSVFAFVGAYLASFTVLPIALFEILIALIQGYVFTVLAATYLALAIAHHPDDGKQTEEEHHPPKAFAKPQQSRI